MATRPLLLLLAGLAFLASLRDADAKCGESRLKDAGQTYIIGGKEARPGEFPWMVSFRTQGDESKYAHRCVGALITESWVLTAAHCILGMRLKDFDVVVGEYDIYDRKSPAMQTFGVEDWVVHPKYSVYNWYENDIALVKLNGRAELTADVEVLCLPHPTYDYAHETGIVAGWGTTSLSQSGYSAKLQYAVMPVQSHADCAKHMRGLTEHMICAGKLYEYDMSACGGDNGAPLVVNRGGGYEIVGVYAWGNGCAQGYPNVYTRVSDFEPWMRDVIWPKK